METVVISFQRGEQRTALSGSCAKFQTDFSEEGLRKAWIVISASRATLRLGFQGKKTITSRTVWSDLLPAEKCIV